MGNSRLEGDTPQRQHLASAGRLRRMNGFTQGGFGRP